ncbi:MAG TPA: HAD-IA family hydrolase [Burkholderiaceae bacterium]|nr:HAD-IA family hydrolase [Burkholderiaceae bacterium]
MSFDIISFDLDGTLLDTAGEIAQAANNALQAHGIDPRPHAEIARLIGEGSRALMLKLLARIFLERPVVSDHVKSDAVLDRFEHELASTLGRHASPYEGVHDGLTRLRQAGVRLACVSNKELRHALTLLRAAALHDLFDLVLGGDSLPERKPHASVLRHVVQVLQGDTRRMAHVGDSHIDVEAARNAGVQAWAVPYGYNAGRPVWEAKPQRIFSGLAEVADHVLASRHLSAALSPVK